MFASKTLSLLSAVAISAVSAQDPTTGQLGNATVVVNNPPGVVYSAQLPPTADFKEAYPNGDNVRGSIAAVANPDGIGVLFKVTFSNLPKEGGPFPYHIHTDPVPADGSCAATQAHLDPFVRGEDPPCDKDLKQTCQVGDLSGKHGAITSDPFEATYLDPFASTVQGIGAYFGNRSFVIHFANKTRITCANFEQTSDPNVGGGIPGGGDIPSPGCTAPASPFPTTAIPTLSVPWTTPLTTPFPTGEFPTFSPLPDPTSIPVSAASSQRVLVGAAGFLSVAATLLFVL